MHVTHVFAPVLFTNIIEMVDTTWGPGFWPTTSIGEGMLWRICEVPSMALPYGRLLHPRPVLPDCKSHRMQHWELPHDAHKTQTYNLCTHTSHTRAPTLTIAHRITIQTSITSLIQTYYILQHSKAKKTIFNNGRLHNKHSHSHYKRHKNKYVPYIYFTWSCSVASSWHLLSYLHLGNLHYLHCCCIQIGREDQQCSLLKCLSSCDLNRTRIYHTYMFRQSIEHSYSSPSIAVIWERA